MTDHESPTETNTMTEDSASDHAMKMRMAEHVFGVLLARVAQSLPDLEYQATPEESIGSTQQAQAWREDVVFREAGIRRVRGFIADLENLGISLSLRRVPLARALKAIQTIPAQTAFEVR